MIMESNELRRKRGGDGGNVPLNRLGRGEEDSMRWGGGEREIETDRRDSCLCPSGL